MDNLEKAFKSRNNSVKSLLCAFLLLLSIFLLISFSLNKGADSVHRITPVFKEIEKKERQIENNLEIKQDFAPLYIAESPKSLEKLEIDTSSLMPSFEEMDYFSKGSLNSSFGEGLMDFENAKIEIFDIAELDKRPVVVERAKINYPRNMLQKGIEGEVRLLVLIDENGNLSLDKVLFATNEYFENSAISALKEFKYSPPEKMGKKVKAKFILPIPFNIHNQ